MAYRLFARAGCPVAGTICGSECCPKPSCCDGACCTNICTSFVDIALNIRTVCVTAGQTLLTAIGAPPTIIAPASQPAASTTTETKSVTVQRSVSPSISAVPSLSAATTSGGASTTGGNNRPSLATDSAGNTASYGGTRPTNIPNPSNSITSASSLSSSGSSIQTTNKISPASSIGSSPPNSSQTSVTGVEELSGPGIAGITLGSVGGLIMILVCIFLFYRRRQQKSAQLLALEAKLSEDFIPAGGRFELSGDRVAAGELVEAPSSHIYELPAEVVELDGRAMVAEIGSTSPILTRNSTLRAGNARGFTRISQRWSNFGLRS